MADDDDDDNDSSSNGGADGSGEGCLKKNESCGGVVLDFWGVDDIGGVNTLGITGCLDDSDDDILKYEGGISVLRVGSAVSVLLWRGRYCCCFRRCKKSLMNAAVVHMVNTAAHIHNPIKQIYNTL